MYKVRSYWTILTKCQAGVYNNSLATEIKYVRSTRALMKMHCFGSLHHSWQMLFEIYTSISDLDCFQNYILDAFCHVRQRKFYDIFPKNEEIG